MLGWRWEVYYHMLSLCRCAQRRAAAGAALSRRRRLAEWVTPNSSTSNSGAIEIKHQTPHWPRPRVAY
jgi:hypothetical protein